jgi:hypothetical protein
MYHKVTVLNNWKFRMVFNYVIYYVIMNDWMVTRTNVLTVPLKCPHDGSSGYK